MAKFFGNRLLGVIFIALLAFGVWLVNGVFTQKFISFDKVTLSTSTTGLQLPAQADVKIRGVMVGEVLEAKAGENGATLTLGIDPSKIKQIPSNVTASILPKTLFGEKYVELNIPSVASDTSLRTGGHITETQQPIEVQSVLNNLYPLLRALQPAELNYTLNALATALDGKGEKLGQTIVTLKNYLTRINPQVPALVNDLGKLSKVSDTYSSVLPQLADTLRNTVKTTNTLKEKQGALRSFLQEARTFSDTAKGFLDTNGDNLIALGKVTVPIAKLLETYSPEYSCFLRGITNITPRLASIFRNYTFHIKLAVLPKQPRGYNIKDKPVLGAKNGPVCLGLSNPNPPYQYPNILGGKVVKNGKTTYPYYRFPNFVDGVDDNGGTLGRGDGQRPATGFGKVAEMNAGTTEQKALIAALTSSALGVDAKDVPDVTGLLFSPVAAGTEVSVK